MPIPKPTLGYPSRTAAVVALRSQGLSVEEIGRRIGITSACVRALECSGLRSKRKPRQAETNGRTVVFPVDILERLEPHAQARGISSNELARRIVDTVLDDGM